MPRSAICSHAVLQSLQVFLLFHVGLYNVHYVCVASQYHMHIMFTIVSVTIMR